MHLNLRIRSEEARIRVSAANPDEILARCERSRSTSLTFASLSLSFFPLRSSCSLRDLVFLFFLLLSFLILAVVLLLLILLANRSTFSSVLVVLPATARFLFFSRGEMERRNGAVWAKSSAVCASSKRISSARRKYSRMFKYNHKKQELFSRWSICIIICEIHHCFNKNDAICLSYHYLKWNDLLK